MSVVGLEQLKHIKDEDKIGGNGFIQAKGSAQGCILRSWLYNKKTRISKSCLYITCMR